MGTHGGTLLEYNNVVYLNVWTTLLFIDISLLDQAYLSTYVQVKKNVVLTVI